jgi:hypothetical protein
MESRPLPSECSAAELLGRADQYRRMAMLASTIETREALIRLAERYERMARKFPVPDSID